MALEDLITQSNAKNITIHRARGFEAAAVEGHGTVRRGGIARLRMPPAATACPRPACSEARAPPSRRPGTADAVGESLGLGIDDGQRTPCTHFGIRGCGCWGGR